MRPFVSSSIGSHEPRPGIRAFWVAQGWQQKTKGSAALLHRRLPPTNATPSSSSTAISVFVCRRKAARFVVGGGTPARFWSRRRRRRSSADPPCGTTGRGLCPPACSPPPTPSAQTLWTERGENGRTRGLWLERPCFPRGGEMAQESRLGEPQTGMGRASRDVPQRIQESSGQPGSPNSQGF